jgi:Sec-independent protein translocase protein TatA
MFGIGMLELIIILVLVLVVFGAESCRIGGALAKASEFQKGLSGQG